MNVLVTMPFSPVPPNFGAALRLYHLLKHLSRRHRVTVLTLAKDPAATAAAIRAEFDVDDVRVVKRDVDNKLVARAGQALSTFSRHAFFQSTFVTRRFRAELRSLLRPERFQVLHTEFSHFGPVHVPQGVIKICDSHNVEYDLYQRMAQTVTSLPRKVHYRLEAFKLKRDEVTWCNQQHALLTTSVRDKDLFQQDGVTVPIEVVPNGVDSEYFSPQPGPVEPHSLVFTGAMSYAPNSDGIGWFLAEVFPLITRQVPTAKIYVVGRDPPASLTALAGPNVVITGSVPDVRPYVNRAAAFVVPLRMGGGTRLKICEAMSMKRPMVSTRIGAEGIDLEDGSSVLFADDPQAFAAATVRLLADSDLQHRLANNAFALAQQRYTWNVIGRALDRVYERLAP